MICLHTGMFRGGDRGRIHIVQIHTKSPPHKIVMFSLVRSGWIGILSKLNYLLKIFLISASNFACFVTKCVWSHHFAMTLRRVHDNKRTFF